MLGQLRLLYFFLHIRYFYYLLSHPKKIIVQKGGDWSAGGRVFGLASYSAPNVVRRSGATPAAVFWRSRVEPMGGKNGGIPQ